ncbi:hypothetical protein M3Y98_00951700 [Aphelenchoides besseyi]|nr:hypothetical protein M3Y98_00951700 [Aphelenchoides besseyi]KAI6194575.1 hypothetical protein M3Y96_01139400 [Aphelenchoides besseyi]
MKTIDLVHELNSLDHFPTEFDPRFFDDVADQILSSDSYTNAVDFVSEIEKRNLTESKTVMCVVLAVLKRNDEAKDSSAIFEQNYKKWMKEADDCSCMQTLFFELASYLAKPKLLNSQIVEDVALTAATRILAEHTNVDLRRDLCAFEMIVMNQHPEFDDIVARPLLAGSHRTDHMMVVDGIAFAIANSDFLRRLTDSEKLAIHERLKGMKRPSLHYIQLAAKIYVFSPDTMIQRLSEEFVNSKIPAVVATEISKLGNPLISKKSLLNLIFSTHLSENVDHLVDCIEEFEEMFPEEVDHVRHEISTAIPNPRHCSMDSLIKYLNHLRLNEGITSKPFTSSILAAKSRIQRNPELLDLFLVDSEDITSLLGDSKIESMFNELTIDVLMSKHQFNWIHLDSAIAILNLIGDFFKYDETTTHDQIAELVNGTNDDEIGYVKQTATKFLLRHAPYYIMDSVDELFLIHLDTDLRLSILNRLILSAANELPSKAKLNVILDEVIQLETNFQVQSAALNLARKLVMIDSSHQNQVSELEKMVREQETRQNRNRGLNMDELMEMVHSVKMSNGCDEECVSKECY